MSWKNFLLIFVVLSTFTSSVMAQSRGGDQATKVLVSSVNFEYEQSTVEVVGTAEALQSVTVFPAVAERVIAVNFAPGQEVAKGNVLVELDNRRQRVAVDRARIQLIDAERNLQRLTESKQRGAVTQSQIDDASTVKQLAEVTLREAQTNLEDRLVRAPFDGVVGLTDVEVGDRITLQTPITTIDNRNQLFVNFNAPESALAALQDNPSIQLQPWTSRDVTINGAVSQIDSRVSATDRTIRVRALLDNDRDKYRPGMSFRVKINTQGQRFAAVPEASLSWGVGGAYVWKEISGKAIKTTVDIKQRLRGRILVTGDLNAQDILIVEGIQRLRDGQNVAPVTMKAG